MKITISMRQYFFIFLLFVNCLAPLFAWSQGEKLGFRIENRGLSGLREPSPEISDNIKVGRFDLGLNASFKRKVDKKKLGLATLTLGAEYRYTRLQYNDFELSDSNSLAENLHMMRLQTDYMKVLNQKWILSIFFRPGIFTDFQKVSLEHFRIEGLALLDYRKSQQTLLGFGVARSANFGRVLILPVFHYLHRSPKFVLDMLLPSRIEIAWIKKKWYYGVNGSLSGNQFRLGNLQNASNGENTVGVSDFTLGPKIRYNTAPKSYIFLTGGFTVLRRWEFRNDDLNNDDRVLQEIDPNLTWFIRSGFVINH